jgi:hypothetical protein
MSEFKTVLEAVLLLFAIAILWILALYAAFAARSSTEKRVRGWAITLFYYLFSMLAVFVYDQNIISLQVPFGIFVLIESIFFILVVFVDKLPFVGSKSN